MTEAENEYVIKGNSAVVKCKIPSFVADFVQVEAWLYNDDGDEGSLSSTELWRNNSLQKDFGTKDFQFPIWKLKEGKGGKNCLH